MKVSEIPSHCSVMFSSVCMLCPSWWAWDKRINLELNVKEGFPGGSVVKNPPANTGDAGDAGSIPGSGRSPGEGSSNLLQYSCLENSMDKGAWWATVSGVTENQKH